MGAGFIIDPVEGVRVGRDPMPMMKALRVRLGLSRAQLGKLCGITASSVQKVEENDRCGTAVGKKVLDTLIAQPIKPWREFAPIMVDGDTAKIRLTGAKAEGRFALIDAEDISLVEGKSWFAKPCSWPKDEIFAASDIGGRTVSLHRFLLGIARDDLVDHRNGDSLDCRRSNIRVATTVQNGQNRRKLSIASSRFKGVHFAANCGMWRSRITCDGIRVDLGLHLAEEDAAIAYDNVAVIAFGQFANLNFPEREMTDEQRAAAADRLAKAREAKRAEHDA